jgi:hypothetical protein
VTLFGVATIKIERFKNSKVLRKKKRMIDVDDVAGEVDATTSSEDAATSDSDDEIRLMDRVKTLKQELRKLSKKNHILQKGLNTKTAETNDLQRQLHNLKVTALKQGNSTRKALSVAAAKAEELKTFPGIDNSLGGIAAEGLVKAAYVLLRDGERTSFGRCVYSFEPRELHVSRDSYCESVLFPRVHIVAPHISRHGRLRCPIDGCNNKAKCTGVKSIKTLFTVSGPELLVVLGFDCYACTSGQGKDDKKTYGKKVGHTWDAIDAGWARQMGYSEEIAEYVVGHEFAFKASLIEQIHGLYGLTPTTVEKITDMLRGVYCTEYYGRLSGWLREYADAHPVHAGRVDCAANKAKRQVMEASLPRDVGDPPGVWSGFSAKTCHNIIVQRAESLEKTQDKFLTMHVRGSKFLSGDHVFSTNRYLEQGDNYDWKGTYTSLNERHYATGAVWVRSESYAALDRFFKEQLFQMSGDRPAGFYVDKCCGRGSFGDCIKRSFGEVWVKLDLYHALRRLRKAAKRHSAEQRAFVRELCRAHWATTDQYRSEYSIHKIPQNERWIPQPLQLEEQLQAVFDKYQNSEAITEGILEWWKNHLVHVRSNCLSDPPEELAYHCADGKVRTGRGSVKNESFHRNAKYASSKWTSCGIALKCAVHRAVITRWNLDNGALVDGRWSPHIQDLNLLKRLHQQMTDIFPSVASSLDHPCLCFPEGFEPMKLWNHYTHARTEGDLRTEYNIPIDKVTTFFSAAFPEPIILAEKPCLLSELSVDPHNYTAIKGLREDPGTVCLQEALGLAYNGGGELQEGRDVESMSSLLLDHVRNNATVYSSLLANAQKGSTDVVDLVDKCLRACTRLTPSFPCAAFVTLKAFATLLQTPVCLLTPSTKSPPLIILPHPDVFPPFTWVPLCVPTFVVRGNSWLRFASANELTFSAISDSDGSGSDTSNSDSDFEEVGKKAVKKVALFKGAKAPAAAKAAPQIETKKQDTGGTRRFWTEVEDELLLKLARENVANGKKNWLVIVDEWAKEKKKRDEAHPANQGQLSKDQMPIGCGTFAQLNSRLQNLQKPGRVLKGKTAPAPPEERVDGNSEVPIEVEDAIPPPEAPPETQQTAQAIPAPAPPETDLTVPARRRPRAEAAASTRKKTRVVQTEEEATQATRFMEEEKKLMEEEKKTMEESEHAAVANMLKKKGEKKSSGREKQKGDDFSVGMLVEQIEYGLVEGKMLTSELLDTLLSFLFQGCEATILPCMLADFLPVPACTGVGRKGIVFCPFLFKRHFVVACHRDGNTVELFDSINGYYEDELNQVIKKLFSHDKKIVRTEGAGLQGEASNDCAFFVCLNIQLVLKKVVLGIPKRGERVDRSVLETLRLHLTKNV